MDKTTAGPGLFEGANNGADGLKVWSTALVGEAPAGNTGAGAGVYGTGGRTRVDGARADRRGGEAEDET